MKSFKVKVNPEVLKWSIQTMNIPEDKILKSVHINKNILNEWLYKEGRPTYVQLQKFSKLAGMSPLIFLSDKIPEEKPGKIFRNYGDNNKKSYKTLKTIKRIEFLQNIVGELYDNLNRNKETDMEEYTVKYRPEELAGIERKKFCSFKDQKKFKTAYEALNEFKSEIENNNIIIMQFPFNDIRGFSLMNKKPFFIVLNSKDNPESRIFTLFHEYAHLLLRKGELNNYDINKDNDEIERWCDNFASYFLITDDIIQEYYNKYTDSIYNKVHKISTQYRLSHSMIFYRFYKLGYIDLITYKKYIENNGSSDNYKNKDKKMGGVDYIKKIRSNYGYKFINLVSENYNRGDITLNDALTYLNIKLNSMKELENSVS